MPPKRPTHYHCGGCEQLLEASQFTEAQKVGRYDQRRRCIACLDAMRTLLETGEMPLPPSQRQQQPAAEAAAAAAASSSSTAPPAASSAPAASATTMPLPPWLAALGITEAQMTPNSWLPIAQFFVSNKKQQQQQFKLITDFICLNEDAANARPVEQRAAAFTAMSSEPILQPLGTLLLEQIKRSDADDLGVAATPASLDALLLVLNHWVSIVGLLPTSDKRFVRGKQNNQKSLWDTVLDICGALVSKGISKRFSVLAAQRWFSLFATFLLHNGSHSKNLTPQQRDLPCIVADDADLDADFAAIQSFCRLLRVHKTTEMLITLCHVATNYALNVARPNPADHDLEMNELALTLSDNLHTHVIMNHGVVPKQLIAPLLLFMGTLVGTSPTQSLAEATIDCIVKCYESNGGFPIDSATESSLLALFLQSLACTRVSSKRITDLWRLFVFSWHSSTRLAECLRMPIFQRSLIDLATHTADFFDREKPTSAHVKKQTLDVVLEMMHLFVALSPSSVHLQLPNSVRLFKRLCKYIGTSYQSLLILNTLQRLVIGSSRCAAATDELYSNGTASVILQATAPLVTTQKESCVLAGNMSVDASGCNRWIEFAAPFTLNAESQSAAELALMTDGMSAAWTTVLQRCAAWSPDMPGDHLPVTTVEAALAAGCLEIAGKQAPAFLTRPLIKALMDCSCIALRQVRREWGGNKPRKSQAELTSIFQGVAPNTPGVTSVPEFRLQSLHIALSRIAVSLPGAVKCPELQPVVEILSEMISDVDDPLMSLVSGAEQRKKNKPKPAK